MSWDGTAADIIAGPPLPNLQSLTSVRATEKCAVGGCWYFKQTLAPLLGNELARTPSTCRISNLSGLFSAAVDRWRFTGTQDLGFTAILE